MDDDPAPHSAGDDDPPPENPLDKLTQGGWRRGVVRLAVAGVVVAAVLHFAGGGALRIVRERDVGGAIVAGALVHLLQRVARVRKWHAMLAPAPLELPGWRYLLRIQLIGMVANQLLPVSEALKVWAVARDRRQAWIGGESIVADTALHAAAVGALGLATAVTLATGLPAAALWAGLAVFGLASLLLVGLARFRRARPAYAIVGGAVLGWALLEAACQIAVYGIAVRALGVDLAPIDVVALSPVLFLADLFMLTPSGLGLREALFAGLLAQLRGAPTDLGVALGLVVSAMVLATTLAGGGLALLLPRAEGRAAPPDDDAAN